MTWNPLPSITKMRLQGDDGSITVQILAWRWDQANLNLEYLAVNGVIWRGSLSGIGIRGVAE